MKTSFAVTKEGKVIRVAKLSNLGTMKALPLPTVWVRWFAKNSIVEIDTGENNSIIIKPCPELMDKDEMKEFQKTQDKIIEEEVKN